MAQDTTAYSPAMKQALARLPQTAKDWIASKGDAQLVFKNEPYYSRVRFEPDSLTADVSGNTTTVFSKGHTVYAFSYGDGGDMKPAGFTNAGTGYSLGTLADTNLTTTTGKVTNNQSDLVIIDGLALIPTPQTDPVLLKALHDQISIGAGFGGNTTDYRWATPIFWPGSAGLHGSSSSQLQQGNLQDSYGIVPGVFANGLPGAADVRWFSDPLVWFPPPDSDGQFQIQLTLQRTRTIVATARAAASGVAPQVPPVTQGVEGTFVDYYVYLIGNQLGPRSKNR